MDLLLDIHNTLWSPVHALILNIPPSRLRLFPSLAGSSWFLTLAALFCTWLGRGMPRYPGQSNPDVPFISDIASFELKPLFLVGVAITTVGFVVTVCAVHVVRYEPGFALINPVSSTNDDEQAFGGSSEEQEHEHEDDNTILTVRSISLFSILAASVASAALIFLAIMDTFRYHRAHSLLLRICFAGLALQAAGTAVVYANEVLGFVSYACHHRGRGRVHHRQWGEKSLKVGFYACLSTALILLQVSLGVAFVSLIFPEGAHYRVAGILEWIIAFLGTVYLWLFVGFLDRSSSLQHCVAREQMVTKVGNDDDDDDDEPNYVHRESLDYPERTPLLGRSARD